MSLDPTGDFFRRYLEEGARRLAELERELEIDARRLAELERARRLAKLEREIEIDARRLAELERARRLAERLERARRLAELERELEIDALPDLVARELAMKGVDLKDVNLMQRAELGCPLSRNDRRRVEFLKEKGVEGDVVTVALERIKRRSSERKVRVTPLDRVSVPVKGPRRQEAREGDACKEGAA